MLLTSSIDQSSRRALLAMTITPIQQASFGKICLYIQLGAHTVRPDVEVHGQYAYLTFNLADLSSAPGAQCAAIVVNSTGPSLKTKVYKKALYHDVGPQLALQDSQPAFQLNAVRCSSASAPIVVKSKMLSNQKGTTKAGNLRNTFRFLMKSIVESTCSNM